MNELDRKKHGLQPPKGADAAICNLEFALSMANHEAAKIKQLVFKAQRAIDAGNAAEIERITEELDKRQAKEAEYRKTFDDYCKQYGLVK